MRVKNVLWIILITLVAAEVTSHITVAAENTRVCVAVSPIKVVGVAVGSMFTINVTVDDVTHLFGYQFILRYNTTVLTATQSINLASITYAPFKYQWASAIDDTEGWVSMAYSCPMAEKVGLTTTQPVPLAQITFSVDADGTSLLNIDEDYRYTLLADVYGNSIKYPSNMIVADGHFSNTEEIKLHDVAITSVAPNASIVNPSDVISLDITVKNNGDFDEAFILSANYNKTATVFEDIGTTMADLVKGASTTLSFNWNTTGVAIGKYIVTAIATLPGEDNPVDNALTSNIITITTSDLTKPIANAGPDLVVNEDIPVIFDGSGSFPSMGIAAYTWTFTDTTPITLTGVNPVYTFYTPGTYTVTLNVTDAAGNWATDTVTITVLDVTPPSANAGQNQTVYVGAQVNFEASGSTDNVGIVSYEWSFGDGAGGEGKTITHTYTSARAYTVTLTVKDAADNTATDQITITVRSAETFPTWIVGAAAATITIGTAVVAAILLLKKRK